MSDVATHEPPPQPSKERIIDLAIVGHRLTTIGAQVCNDLLARAEVERAKYGTYLETYNGRDALMDAYQEALDLLMYLEQWEAESGQSDTTLMYNASRAAYAIRATLNGRDSPKMSGENGRLIAAAPDLFEALDRAMTDVGKSMSDDVRTQAQTALDRALGRPQ